MSNLPLRHLGITSRITVFVLLLTLCVNTTFAAPESGQRTVLVLASVGQDIRLFARTVHPAATVSAWAGNFFALVTGKKAAPVQLTRVEIIPGGEITIRQGEPINFTGIGYTTEGHRMSGLRFRWTVEDTARKTGPHNLPDGVFKAQNPGTYIIRTSAQGFQAQTVVTVEENRALMTLRRIKAAEANGDRAFVNKFRKNNQYRTEEISSKRVYKQEAEEQKPVSTDEVVPPDSQAKRLRGPNAGDAAAESPATAAAPSPVMMRPADQDGWGNDNWWMADDFGNHVGDPPGTSPDAGAGNGNFQFSAPIVSLPGRGMDVGLSLNYNSRVWSKAGNVMAFDAERGFPAPGWNLGFGKMMFMGTSGGCMLIDADGTNRGYTGTVSNYNWGGYASTFFTGQTVDGSFIDYQCYVSTYNGVTSISGSSTLPNGTRHSFNNTSVSGKQAFPTQIWDVQGNYINITYRNYQGPQIQTVTDTMGRVVSFNYDSGNRLISVDVPRMDGGTRTAVKLHYKSLTLSAGFAYPLTADTNAAAPDVIDAIYYPGTGTGYWFNDSDSYSSYGMIAKVLEQRGMSWSGSAGTQGTVTQGTMSKQAVYNYPLTANNALTDAPTYTAQSETWDGNTTPASVKCSGANTNEAVTCFSINMASSPRSITVTKPNGVKSEQLMFNAAGQWNDGLIYQDRTLDASNNQLNKSYVWWEQGAYNSPRPNRTDVTDERGNVLKTTYAYGTLYNQLTSEKKYDYDGVTILREARKTYENNANYTGRHIFNLVKTAEIYDGASNRVSKTDYEYDGNAVVNGTGNPNLKETDDITMHFAAYDPHTDETQQVNGVCLNQQWNHSECSYEGQEVWVPTAGGYYESCHAECLEYEQLTVSVYDPGTIFRGNVTKTTVYADAAAATGAIVQTKQYDTPGNLVAESASCCELKTYDYTLATQFAYPSGMTRGSSDPNSSVINTSTALFDFETGLTEQSTDANGKTTTTTYDLNSLRATQTTSSTGAYSTSTYNDAAMTVTNESREYGGALAEKTVSYLNGLGKTRREDRITGSITDIIETQYTQLGEVWKKSKPYRSGDTVQWTEIIYDLLGRTSQIVEPDGSSSKAFYNITPVPAQASGSAGETMKTVDPWGRERWTRKDALGRLAEIVEPKADGNGLFAASGNLSTTYAYNTLDKMTQSDQGGQLRKFAYDSLGRMTRQKLAEQSATINAAGTWVGEGQAGALWSGAVFYDERSNVTERIDPRGIKAKYEYKTGGVDDPLNRIQEISYVFTPGYYDTSKPIAAAATVTYEYMTSGDKSRVKKIRTAGLLTEDFVYDTEGRVRDYTQTVDYRPNSPWALEYTYDTLDRVINIKYPDQYNSPASGARKNVAYTYDASSRLSGLTFDGLQQAGDMVFNAGGQLTSDKIGTSGTNQITEDYTFDPQTGLMTNQKVWRNGATLLDLSYDYTRNNSAGNTTASWKTGSVTKILDNKDHAKDREYQYDALGRLVVAKGKASNQWTQSYTYDRYGNRLSVGSSGTAANGSTIPTDGLPSVTYETASNRMAASTGFQYDSAGNQTRGLAEDGTTWLKFEYDAANRLQAVKNDATNAGVQAFQYGSNNARLIDWSGSTGKNSFIMNVGGKTIAEYIEHASTVPTWTKSNIYMGDRLLSTNSANSTSTGYTEFHHPDRLGTRLITNQALGTNYEQAHLPFGGALDAESTIFTNPKRFTSYERSNLTGQDYAQNRVYSAKQGRFTQVDPIGMNAASLFNPQSLNLYNYVGNDPINRTDPDGLFWGWLKRLFQAIIRIVLAIAIVVALVVIAIVIPPAGILGWAAFIGAAVVGFKYATTLLGGLREVLKPCNVPSYAKLSQARRDELAQRGVSAEQWDSLRNKQRLGYFNIVAAMASAGLSLLGWLVDWAAGGIQQDRVFFMQGQGATNLLAQVMASSIFRPDKFGGGSFRSNSFTRSTELTFSSEGRRLEVDIDAFNPNRLGSFFPHGFEILAHALGRFLGGGRKTNPYNVAYRSSWECG